MWRDFIGLRCQPPRPRLGHRGVGFMQTHPLPPPVRIASGSRKLFRTGGGYRSIISFQRGEHPLPPPFDNPPLDEAFCPREGYLSQGSKGRSPLKILLNINNEIPPPAPAREQLPPWAGRGRGQGVGSTKPLASRQARRKWAQQIPPTPQARVRDTAQRGHAPPPKTPASERSERIGVFPAPSGHGRIFLACGANRPPLLFSGFPV